MLAEERAEAEDINQKWRDLEQAVKDVSEETVGYKEGTRSQYWFDDECRRAASERKQARINHLQYVNDLGKKELFRQKRRTAVRINLQKRREAFNKDLDKIDRDRQDGIRKVKREYQALSNTV